MKIKVQRAEWGVLQGDQQSERRKKEGKGKQRMQRERDTLDEVRSAANDEVWRRPKGRKEDQVKEQ